MSKSTKVIIGLCMVAFVAACAKKQEEVVFVEQPIVAEAPMQKY